MTVREFLSKAWSKTDCVALHDITTEEQEPHYMAVMTARESLGDWLVDAFSVGDGLFCKNDKVLHLWIYESEEVKNA